MNPNETAKILVEALPYIQKYRGKTIVIKYGGNAMVNEELKQAVIQDVVLLNMVGVHVVLVHGGGPEISSLLEKVGKESRFINGLRYTDQETMEFVQMALCGKVNKDLVSLLEKQGGKAVGLSGLDDALVYETECRVAVAAEIASVGLESCHSVVFQKRTDVSHIFVVLVSDFFRLFDGEHAPVCKFVFLIIAQRSLGFIGIQKPLHRADKCGYHFFFSL